MVLVTGREQIDSACYRPVSLTSISGKVMEKILLESISKHMKDKKALGREH